ncbi:40S ribosomal protein S19-3 [Tanacetum coccineum]
MTLTGTTIELRIYGRSKRNGSAPPHFCKASGGIARNILQQLQSMNIVDFDSKGGRKITSNGRRDLVQVTGRKSSGCYPLSEPSRFHLLSQQNHLKRPIISSTIQSETDARLPDEYEGSPFLYKVYFRGVELQVDAFAVNQTVSDFGIYNSDMNLDLLLHFSHDCVVDDWNLKVRRVEGTHELVQLQVQDVVNSVRIHCCSEHVKHPTCGNGKSYFMREKVDDQLSFDKVEPHHYALEVKRMINEAHPGMFPDEDKALIFDDTKLGDWLNPYGYCVAYTRRHIHGHFRVFHIQ